MHVLIFECLFECSVDIVQEELVESVDVTESKKINMLGYKK